MKTLLYCSCSYKTYIQGLKFSGTIPDFRQRALLNLFNTLCTFPPGQLFRPQIFSCFKPCTFHYLMAFLTPEIDDIIPPRLNKWDSLSVQRQRVCLQTHQVTQIHYTVFLVLSILISERNLLVELLFRFVLPTFLRCRSVNCIWMTTQGGSVSKADSAVRTN